MGRIEEVGARDVCIASRRWPLRGHIARLFRFVRAAGLQTVQYVGEPRQGSASKSNKNIVFIGIRSVEE